MSIWSRLLGSSGAIKDGMDLVDKAIYTKQEKAEDANKGIALKATLLKSYEPFKLAQRILMLIVVPPYVLMCFITWALSFKLDTSHQEALLSGDLGTLAILIGSFYFGGGTIESLSKLFKRT